MASEKEVRTQQRSMLYDLLKLQQDMEQGKGAEGLAELVRRAVAIMDEEDVAYVEKRLKQE